MSLSKCHFFLSLFSSLNSWINESLIIELSYIVDLLHNLYKWISFNLFAVFIKVKKKQKEMGNKKINNKKSICSVYILMKIHNFFHISLSFSSTSLPIFTLWNRLWNSNWSDVIDAFHRGLERNFQCCAF